MASNNGPRSRSATVGLVLMGLALITAGIAVVVAPGYYPDARGIVENFERLTGIQSGVLVLGGLVFLSLGVLSRGITRLSSVVRVGSGPSRRDTSADLSLVVEQFAGDVAQLRGAVDQVMSDVGRTSETLQYLLQGQEALRQLQGQPREAETGQHMDSDALYRLAGSLDQMYARLDERLNVLTARIDERLASLQHS